MLRLRYSWRLGYIITVLFTILVVTGVYLMFFYTPSVNAAYEDMQQLRTGIGFGQLVRLKLTGMAIGQPPSMMHSRPIPPRSSSCIDSHVGNACP